MRAKNDKWVRNTRARRGANVLDATVSGVSDSLVVETSKEARSNKGIEDVVTRGESALSGKERGEESDCREHFWMSVVGVKGEPGVRRESRVMIPEFISEPAGY